jgi:APA family basic amino acid/polyamine antiporter
VREGDVAEEAPVEPPGEEVRRRRLRLARLALPGGVTRRYLGVPWLFAVVWSAVGLSIYFALGLVADRGLGLTPLIFLAAGLLFVLTALTYVEASAMYVERGGSATFARYAFNELVSFVAGWAILIDYIIVIALAAISVPHYLSPISESLAESGAEVAIAGAVIALVAVLNVIGFAGRPSQFLLTVVVVGGVVLMVAVIVVGAITSWDPGAVTAELDLFSSPSVEDLIYALVIATVAYAGIEVASNLAPDFRREEPVDLRRLVVSGAVTVPLLYAGVAFVALMAVPVVATAGGPATDLGGRFIEDPILGVVQSFEPRWIADVMEVGVVALAPAALVWAASTSMLGLSRHIYVLATNRQIPSWLGKLSRTWSTPHMAIVIGALISFGLAIPGDVMFLAGVYAFGALLAITIAHLALLRLRVSDAERPRPFRVAPDVGVLGRSLPLPTLVAAALTLLAWLSVIAFHEGARYLGGGWMLFGLGGYVVYRRYVEGTSLTKRVTVPERALMKEEPEFEYERILVPVFGTELDDDIVGTAGRLADAADEPGEIAPRLDVIYVIELPLTVPLDAPPPPAKLREGEAALERAREIAEEYESVEVTTSMVRDRSVGAGIVGEARRRAVEAIVLGGEPPTRIRGGAILGGIGGARPDAIGPVTEYVLRKAPCAVLLTAPPEVREPEV